MTLPLDTKLILEGELIAEADLWAAVHHSIAELCDLNRFNLVTTAKKGPGLIPGTRSEQPMTAPLQLALAQRAVADRLARRRE